ncbi:urease accessory protein UreF [Aquabacterium sp. J223]|uniref:urease accessory protein UreF n=1 Tax=Aquabacterium sp. J223 TaxID=2898431 RepID=UPI003916EAAA
MNALPRPAPPTQTVADTAPALLRLLWLASPALPVGGFSYSEGLESAVDAGVAADEPRVAAWLDDQLALGLARGDLAIAGAAIAAWGGDDDDTIQRLNDWVLHSRETAEGRLQAEQMGRSLADWLRQRAEGDPPALARCARLAALAPAPTWPIAFALAAAHSGAAPRDALLAMGFAWAENQVQAAIKAVPLGQSAGQRILQRLAAALPAAVDEALARGEAGAMAFTPRLAILSSRHETQYSRLFRS